MLTTYQRLMDAGKVTRTGTVTYDNRPQDELVKQLQAEVEALRLRVRELTGEAGVGPKAQTADLITVWCDSCGYTFSINPLTHGGWAICPNCTARTFIYKDR